jgi:hypothetical protein
MNRLMDGWLLERKKRGHTGDTVGKEVKRRVRAVAGHEGGEDVTRRMLAFVRYYR